MAVEAVPFLQTQAVACTQTDRCQTEVFAYLEECIPDLLAMLLREIQLKSARTGIARIAKDDALHACEGPLAERIIRNRTQIGVGQQLQELSSLRTLHRQLAVAVAGVLQLHTEGVVLVDPSPVLVDITGIHDEQVFGGGVFVDDQVVHDTAFAVRETGVLCLACFEFADVVRGDILQEIEGFLAFHPELAHVAHIEHTYAFAHNHVFLVDTRRVLNRHVEARKIGHLRS